MAESLDSRTPIVGLSKSIFDIILKQVETQGYNFSCRVSERPFSKKKFFMLLVMLVMIRNGPWAALWCPWLVPAGSCNAPTSQQLLRGYLTILPPAHQYYRYNKQESESGHWKKGEKKWKWPLMIRRMRREVWSTIRNYTRNPNPLFRQITTFSCFWTEAMMMTKIVNFDLSKWFYFSDDFSGNKIVLFRKGLTEIEYEIIDSLIWS